MSLYESTKKVILLPSWHSGSPFSLSSEAGLTWLADKATEKVSFAFGPSFGKFSLAAGGPRASSCPQDVGRIGVVTGRDALSRSSFKMLRCGVSPGHANSAGVSNFPGRSAKLTNRSCRCTFSVPSRYSCRSLAIFALGVHMKDIFSAFVLHAGISAGPIKLRKDKL